MGARAHPLLLLPRHCCWRASCRWGSLGCDLRVLGGNVSVAASALGPGARNEWVRSLALGAEVVEATSCVTAPLFVEAEAYLASNRMAPRLWAHVCTLGVACPGRGVREPPNHRSMRVSGALLGVVVVLETVGATGDRSGTACEGLVVESRVRYRPVEILQCQCLAAVLAIVRDPPLANPDSCGQPVLWRPGRRIAPPPSLGT